MDRCIGSKRRSFRNPVSLSPLAPLQLETKTNHHPFPPKRYEYDEGLDRVHLKFVSNRRVLKSIRRHEEGFGERLSRACHVLSSHVAMAPFFSGQGQWACLLPEGKTTVSLSKEEESGATVWTWRVGKAVTIALVLPKGASRTPNFSHPVLRMSVSLSRLHLLLGGSDRGHALHGNSLMMPDTGQRIQRQMDDLTLLRRVSDYFRMPVADMLHVLGVSWFDLVGYDGRILFDLPLAEYEAYSDLRRADGKRLSAKQNRRLRKTMLAANDGEPLEPLKHNDGEKTRRRSRAFFKHYARGHGVERLEATVELPADCPRCRKNYVLKQDIQSFHDATRGIFAEMTSPGINRRGAEKVSSRLLQRLRSNHRKSILYQRNLTPALIRDGLATGLIIPMPGKRAGYRVHHRLVRSRHTGDVWNNTASQS